MLKPLEVNFGPAIAWLGQRALGTQHETMESIENLVTNDFFEKNMTNENTKSHNLFKKVTLLHDGVENDFIKKNTIKCPHCDGIVEFDLYSSSDFNKFDKSTQQTIAKDIKGLKADSRGIDELTYKGEFVGFCTKVCSCGEHTLMIFFTFSEIQPARYISHLIGVFDANYISSI